MSVLLMLVVLAATPSGAIDASIRGTSQPLEVDLFLRDAQEDWQKVGHQALPRAARRVRFDGLAPGVYQILLRGPVSTEQLSTKLVVGTEPRKIAIDVKPFVVSGRVTLGGTDLGAGTILLQQREFRWRAGIGLATNGAFRATMWQRGAFSYSVQAPALPTPYAHLVTLDGPSPWAIDIPDGRVRGVVRDARSNAPVPNATVLLRTVVADGESNLKLITAPDGSFDFVGIRRGKQTVRVIPRRHLEPAPVAFSLDDATPQRELDVRVDPGRAVAIVVIDKDDDPVQGAKVFAVSDAQVCARTTTDEDGMATIAVPADQPATLFAVAKGAPFGMLRVGPRDEKERRRIYLPRASSSLLLRALRTDGRTMPPFSLLMRFNGELVPAEVAEALAATQGLQLETGPESEAHLQNIPAGTYEFWPYRTDEEVESIVAAGATFPPIQVDVRSGENKVQVKFAAKYAK